MTRPIILAIDEGTTNAKAVCIDQGGRIISSGFRSLNLHHPKASWSEQNPMEIIQAVKDAIADALNSIENYQVSAVAISNQRESVMLWDRASGDPISPLVTWQCRRSEPFCQQLASSGQASSVQAKTGLPIDPLFPAAKIRWLIDNTPNVRNRAMQGEICIGTVDTWLVWNLTNQAKFVTDVSNASRTQLFNIHTQEWDKELLEIFDLPESCLAEVMPSAGLRGETSGFGAIPDGVPILSQIGDSHAALYGQGGFMPGVIKATYGTGSSLMTPVLQIANDDYRLAHTVAWNDGDLTYALEGNITHTGAAVSWMSKILGVDIADMGTMAESAENHEGIYFVPALSGLGAPHWKSEARGLIAGLSDNTKPENFARAALEAIAFQVADVFYLMEKMSGLDLDMLLVDGGPTRNRWLMQFQADLLQRPVMRSEISEVSALGAGYLAGKAMGWWKTRDELHRLNRETEVINPSAQNQIPKHTYQGWLEAVNRTH